MLFALDRNPPTHVSHVAGITGMSHSDWPCILSFISLINMYIIICSSLFSYHRKIVRKCL
jgi:hypothetical protein